MCCLQLMDVDGGESDWQSSSTANAIWSTAGTSASHSAAATSTHPVHLPSNRGTSSVDICHSLTWVEYVDGHTFDADPLSVHIGSGIDPDRTHHCDRLLI